MAKRCEPYYAISYLRQVQVETLKLMESLKPVRCINCHPIVSGEEYEIPFRWKPVCKQCEKTYVLIDGKLLLKHVTNI